MPSDGNQWLIGLDAYMICDGYYPDFYVGQVIDFSVVFYSTKSGKQQRPRLDGMYLEPSNNRTIGATVIDNDDYLINGQTIYANEKGWVVDIGIRVAARTGHPAKWAKAGEYVRGRTFLFPEWGETEPIRKDPSSPYLVYSWRINRIQMLTSETEERIDLSATNARTEFERIKSTAYLLTCTKLDSDPRRITKRRQNILLENKLRRLKHGLDR